MVENFNQRKESSIARSAKCVQRTTREQERLDRQQKAKSLIHIDNRTDDDDQRSKDLEELQWGIEAYEDDQDFLTSAERGFEFEQTYHKETHAKWKAQFQDPTLSPILEWVLINHSSIISDATQNSNAGIEMKKAWVEVRANSVSEFGLLEKEKSCLDTLEDGFKAESGRLQHLHKLHDEEKSRIDKENEDHTREFELRCQERQKRLEKETFILTDLSAREKRTRACARIIISVDKAISARESRATTRMSDQLGRLNDLRVPLNAAANEAEGMQQLRIERESSRLEAQKTEACILAFNRKSDNEDRSSCDDIRKK